MLRTIIVSGCCCLVMFQMSLGSQCVPLDVRTGVGNLCVPFIVNQGQYPEDVAFCANTLSGGVFVSQRGEILYAFRSSSKEGTNTCISITENFVGGSISDPTGMEKAPVGINYFKGADPSKWRTNVPSYERVNMDEVYEGIDISLRSYGANVEKLFYVLPGADPHDIQVGLNGADRITVGDNGELQVYTQHGVVAFTKPMAYQETGAGKKIVDVAYALQGNQYGFAVGEYDATGLLVIDPLLASTYLGGSNPDGNYDIASVVDDEGNLYIASRTMSWDFPFSPEAYDTSFNYGSSDVFISKLSGDLTTLLASTFLGGSGQEGGGFGINLALDSDGSVYVACNTNSTNFPTTPGAYSDTIRGEHDAFVSKLGPDLDTLLASTFLGGADDEKYISMTLDSDGYVCVAGCTDSPTFPYTSGVYDTTLAAGGHFGFDTFVSKLSPDLTSLIASTFIGGNQDDFVEAVVLDSYGNVYVAGWTASPNYPTSTTAYDRSFNYGIYDAFVSRLSGDLTELSASTFLGGSEWDFGYALTLDPNGNVFVSGHTASRNNFPWSHGAYDTTYNGTSVQDVDDDAFVSKFDSSLTSLLASTFMGGETWENTMYMITDETGNIYIGGFTDSDDFPTTPEAYDTLYNGGISVHTGDVFVSKLNNDLATLLASTFLGGNHDEILGSLVIDQSHDLFVVGGTLSSNFPIIPGAYQPEFQGGAGEICGDIFISKLDDALSTSGTSIEHGLKDQQQPSLYCLYQNYPNPYNPTTNIRFSLPLASDVRLTIHDILGRNIATLVEDQKPPGNYTITWQADNLPSGTYFYQLKAGDYYLSKPMILLK